MDPDSAKPIGRRSALLVVLFLTIPLLAVFAQSPGGSAPAVEGVRLAWLMLAGAAASLFLNALFILAQSSVAAVGPASVEMVRGGGGGAWWKRFLTHRREYERLFWAGSICFMGMMLAFAGYAGALLGPTAPLVGPAIAVLFGLLAHFLVIEVFCRNLALSHALGIFKFLVPVVWILAQPMKLLLIPFQLARGADPFPKDSESITDMELRLLPSLRGVDRIIDEDVFEMIDSVKEFMEARAEDIMTPRTEVEGIPRDLAVAEVYERLRAAENSRVVVYEEDLDHVVGILLVKEILLQRPEDPMSLLRKPVVASEATTLPELLRVIRQNRTHLVVVLDEYGGMAGIVTLHDLIESIVGHIEDDGDEEELWISRVDERRFRLNGRVEVWEVNDELGLNLDEELARTIGGYVFNSLGRVAQDGDSIETAQALISVEVSRENRVETVLLELHEGVAAPALEPEEAQT